LVVLIGCRKVAAAADVIDNGHVTDRTHRRHATWLIGVGAAVAVGTGVWFALPSPTGSAVPSPTVTARPSAVAAPPVAAPAENTASYDLSALPQITVFAVNPGLAVDTNPTDDLADERVRAIDVGAPVFAEPTGDPLAYLPRDFEFDGTTVPVVERSEHWIKVLLPGRQAVPSAGDAGQLTGWVRAQDVETLAVDVTVEVDISARTVDIVRGGVTTRVADDLGWGADATPTPIGRTFIMTTRAEPTFEYTRGHPIVYFGVQSPTLDGFGGAEVAVTAFHYHDDRSGPISNGCLRLDEAAIDALSDLPPGTPVIIRS
jgi:hypothetical protein